MEYILNAPYVETLLLLITIALTLILVTRLIDVHDRRKQARSSAKREEDDMKLIQDIIKKTKR